MKISEQMQSISEEIAGSCPISLRADVDFPGDRLSFHAASRFGTAVPAAEGGVHEASPPFPEEAVRQSRRSGRSYSATYDPFPEERENPLSATATGSAAPPHPGMLRPGCPSWVVRRPASVRPGRTRRNGSGKPAPTDGAIRTVAQKPSRERPARAEIPAWRLSLRQERIRRPCQKG